MATDETERQRPAWGERELKHFEERLLDERKRAVAQMGQFQDQVGVSEEDATGELSSWRFHMADIGTKTYERLDAIPYVVRCVNCKQSWEGGQLI